MVESFALTSAFWRLVSGLPLIFLGILCLRGGRARPRGSWAFGLFTIAWGLQIALGNLVSLVDDPRVAARIYLLFVATLPLTGWLLVEFARSQASTKDSSLAWGGARTLALALSVTVITIIFTAPETFVRLVAAPDGAAIERGPLVDLFMISVFAAFALALWTLHRAWRDAPSPRTAVLHAVVLGGLSVILAFTASYYLVLYGVDLVVNGEMRWLAFVAVFALIAWMSGAIALASLRTSHAGRTAAERNRGRLLAVATVVAFLWGAGEALLNYGPLRSFSTLGLWRIAGVGVIAYGLARWRLPDLPQRATRIATSGAGAATAAAGGVAAYGAATLATASPVAPAIVGLIATAAALIPGIRLAQRLFARASREPLAPDADDRYGARVEAYRAALEASLARGSFEEDADFLNALRERFGITESEDRLLRHYARACVFAPRQGDADVAYERLRLLGEGGAGRTWLARDRVRDRLVVLKEPLERWQRDPAVREMVLREARLAARVRHANVVRVEEVLEHKGAPIIVMEFCEGGSVAELLRRRGVLPWREATELAVQVLRGVEAIHAGGIIHRDLKPSNVLLTADGEPKIADFGIAVPARALEAPGSSDRTVIQGTTFVGTYAYLAPEVRAGEPGDKRADVYAAAAMLHEALYGSPPGLQLPVLAQNSVPAELSRILARALAPDPAQRHATARLLAEELTSITARGRA